MIKQPQQKNHTQNEEFVQRFEKTEIVLHWANGAPFLLLLASGLFILLARFIIFNPIVLLLIRYTHKTAAVTWLVSLGISYFFVGRRLNFADFREVFTIDSRDFAWILSAVRSIYNRNVRVPDVGKFNIGQKINTILVYLYIPAFAATGVSVWFFGTLLTPWIIHTSLFFIACSSVCGHLYLAFFHPSTRSGLDSVFTGMVPKSYMVHHHALALPVEMRGGHDNASDDSPDRSFVKVEIIILLMMVLGGIFGVRAFTHIANLYLHRSFDSVVSPRELSVSHRIREITDCKKCHGLDGQILSSQCFLCHKTIQQRRETGIGYHGANKAEPCNKCHKEHPVFSESITVVNMNKFNHDVTDFKLAGKHAAVECNSCHKKIIAGDGFHPGSFYIGVPHDSCFTCHRKKDPHSGSLGEKCEPCHKPAGWKNENLLFSHVNAPYRLEGKHQDVHCAKCHKPRTQDVLSSAVFRGVKHGDCSDCHKNQHPGDIKKLCATCHEPQSWQNASLTFNHERNAEFNPGVHHKSVVCIKCHKPRKKNGPLGTARFKLNKRCTTCHNEQWVSP